MRRKKHISQHGKHRDLLFVYLKITQSAVLASVLVFLNYCMKRTECHTVVSFVNNIPVMTETVNSQNVRMHGSIM